MPVRACAFLYHADTAVQQASWPAAFEQEQPSRDTTQAAGHHHERRSLISSMLFFRPNGPDRTESPDTR